jgi:hypothetical protein
VPRVARIVLGGTLGGGADVWSCGWNYSDPDQIAPYEATTAQAWADAVEAGILTIVGTNLRECLSVSGSITSISTYLYEDIGQPAQYVGFQSLAQAGTGGAIHDLQTAVVCSLRTTLATRRGRGRIYWPAVGQSLQSNGRMISTEVDGLVGNFRTMFEGVAAAWPETGELDLGVVSTVGATFTPVNRIQVGDVLDNQRRRRDALVENYTTLVYPA